MMKTNMNNIPNTKKVLLFGSNFDFLIFKINGFILLKKLSNELFIDKNRFLTFFANKLSLFMIVAQLIINYLKW